MLTTVTLLPEQECNCSSLLFQMFCMSHCWLWPAGRSVLCIAGTVQGHKVAVATSHLESPCGSNQMYSKERKAQLRHVSPCSCVKLECLPSRMWQMIDWVLCSTEICRSVPQYLALSADPCTICRSDTCFMARFTALQSR